MRELMLTKGFLEGKTGLQNCKSKSARRKQGWCGADTSEEGDKDDNREVGEQRHAVKEVMENLGLKHPIIFDVCNLCQYYHGNKLSSFNVSMFKDMYWYFEIPYKSRDPLG